MTQARIDPERQEEFDRLQSKLRPLWETISHLTDVEQTIVVVPSLSLGTEFLEKIGPRVLYYEERLLFLLFLLRQPRARVIFISSMPIEEQNIDYVLSLLPGVIPSQARRRLHLISAEDESLEPLAQKLLSRPDLIGEIRSLISNADRAHLVPYITTELERDLALELGIPVYGCDPRLSHLGSKSGGKKIFEEAGVPQPTGATELSSISELASAVATLRSKGVTSLLVKLNESASGLGNAELDVSSLPLDAPASSVEKAIGALHPPENIPPESFLKEFESGGGVVEELIRGEEIRSPSVQLRVTPLGEVEILSTHDQLLGGESGQIYLGCIFPADGSYAPEITRSAAKIGKKLAEEGVLGRFAIDFVSVEKGGAWDHYAVEINLRKGGTTHPYLTLQYLTDGSYDFQTGRFLTPNGIERCLVATDHASLRSAISIDQLFDLAVTNRLHFDNARQSGVVFHMLGSLERYATVGLTSVAETRETARTLFDRTLELLGAEL